MAEMGASEYQVRMERLNHGCGALKKARREQGRLARFEAASSRVDDEAGERPEPIAALDEIADRNEAGLAVAVRRVCSVDPTPRENGPNRLRPLTVLTPFAMTRARPIAEILTVL